ncbi:MAG: hypothetical protein P8104_09995 [Gammaproteobacteria bacterium]
MKFEATIHQEGENFVATVQVTGGKPFSTLKAHVHEKPVPGEKDPAAAGGHYRKGEIDQNDEFRLDENGNGTMRIVIPPKDGNMPDISAFFRSVVLHDSAGKRLGVDNLLG